MSGIDWNGILRLPEAALAGCRRIPKTVLVKQAMLTKTEQKRLDKVARLEHFATVQKSTTRIPPYEDDERNVQSVVFLRCEMTAGTMAVAEVAELVHKCFPNPTVLLVEAGGCACISVALTRRSQAEQGATVVDRVESTGRVRSWPFRIRGLPRRAGIRAALAGRPLGVPGRPVAHRSAVPRDWRPGVLPRMPRSRPGKADRPHVALR